MKKFKKFISLTLSCAMVMSLCVPALAVETRDSRHDKVVETDPEWTYCSTLVITAAEAESMDKFYGALGKAMTGVAELGDKNLADLAEKSYNMIKSAAMMEEGTYVYKTKSRITYSVDMLTGTRHVQREELLFQITFTCNGKSTVKETAYTLR